MPQNNGLDGLVQDPDFARLAPDAQRRVLAKVSGEDDFTRLSDSETSKYIAGHQKAVGFTPPPSPVDTRFSTPEKAAQAVDMKESVAPKAVRLATGTLPALGATGGGVAGVGLGANPVGVAAGAVLGGEAGKQAEIAANNKIFGENTDQASPYNTAEGLKETAIRAPANAMGGVAESMGGKVLAKEAAQKVAATQGADETSQITKQLVEQGGNKAVLASRAREAADAASTAEQTLTDSAKKVANLASKATDEGITVDPSKTLNTYIKGLPPAEQDHFMEVVQPKISEIGQQFGKLAKTSPRDVLKYRDAVYSAIKSDSDPNIAKHAEEIYEGITSDLQSVMKEKGYKGFSAADNRIPSSKNVLDTASGVKEATPTATPKPNFQTVPIPSDAPSIEEVEKSPSLYRSAKQFAKNHPVITAAAGAAAGAVLPRSLSSLMKKVIAP